VGASGYAPHGQPGLLANPARLNLAWLFQGTAARRYAVVEHEAAPTVTVTVLPASVRRSTSAEPASSVCQVCDAPLLAVAVTAGLGWLDCT
jgi:hypothetical protein